MEAATEGQVFAVVKPRETRQRVPADAELRTRQIYRELSRAWGPQHWWPAETPFEVIVGAILTQNTSWTNVERALASLRQSKVLSLEGIRNLPLAELETLVRPSGYFRQKASRLKSFVQFVDERHSGSLQQMFAVPHDELRAQLLALKGIGKETADSILLYAGLKPVFVVDAYARRIFERHEIIHSKAEYDEIRALVEDSLRSSEAVCAVAEQEAGGGSRPPVHPPSAMSCAQQSALSRVYNEMHGLIVQVGKHHCYKQHPDCGGCPLREMLTPEQRALVQEKVSGEVGQRVGKSRKRAGDARRNTAIMS